MTGVVGLDHLQLAMPRGREADARAFYGDVLGLAELTKPPHLAARGGVWFALGSQQLHLGVEDDFRPARKAHPALLVHDLRGLRGRLELHGFAPYEDEPLAGYERFYVADPFGNRLELLEPVAR
jgi:catechol 2,3-dioxygenase-like lactoylglutathione lyase family enzyme